MIIARQKVLLCHSQGRGDNSTDIYLRTWCKIDTVWIDKKNLTIRSKVAKNCSRISAEYTIQRDRSGTRLLKINRLMRADAKAMPIKNSFLTRLGNRKHSSGFPDASLATNNFSTNW